MDKSNDEIPLKFRTRTTTNDHTLYNKELLCITQQSNTTIFHPVVQ